MDELSIYTSFVVTRSSYSSRITVFLILFFVFLFKEGVGLTRCLTVVEAPRGTWRGELSGDAVFAVSFLRTST